MIEPSRTQNVATDRSHIRLVDQIRQSPPPPPAASVSPKKGKKKKTKKQTAGIQGRGPAKDAGAGKSKQPKLKGPKALVKRILGLQDALKGLRQRLKSLDTGRVGQVSANARQSRPLDTVERESQSGKGQQDAPRGHRDTLTRAVASASKQPPPADRLAEIGLGLDRIAERMARVESRLAAIPAQNDDSDPLPPRLADLAGRVAAATRMLETERNRIEQAEQTAADIAALREGQDALQSGQQSLSGEMRQLRDHVDGRVDSLSSEVVRLGDDGETAQHATDAHLRRLGRDRAIALALAATAVVAVLGLGWWQQQGLRPATPAVPAMTQAPQPDNAIVATNVTPISLPTELETALERITDRLEQLQSTDPSGPYTADLLDRLRRLETGMLDLTRALASDDQGGDDLSARLSRLVAAQQALEGRIDEVEQGRAGTEQRIALLDTRLDRQAQAEAEALDPSRHDTTLVVDADGAYGVQLVVYESRRRVAPFVATHGLGDRARAMEIRMDGREAYAVLLAPFADTAQATAAIAKLAPQLKALGPWIRDLAPGTSLLEAR